MKTCDCSAHPVEVTPIEPRYGPAEARITIAGMHCATCVSRVRGALAALDGVARVEVHLSPAVAHVWFDAARVSLAQLCRAIARSAAGTAHSYQGVAMV